MCASISGDLQDIAVTFFTNNGKPRASVPCVHQALTSEGKSLAPFLYIKDFELDVDYRIHTNVGSRALRSLLADTALAKQWSLAMYLPSSATQLSGEDAQKQKDISRLQSPWMQSDELTEAQKQDLQDWKDYRLELTRKDMRQFFRAGFRQVQDPSVICSKPDGCFYLYLAPSYLDLPQISHEGALEVSIVEAPPPTKEKSPTEKEFFQKMKSWCSERNELLGVLQSYSLPLSEIPQFRSIVEGFQQSLSKSQFLLERGEENLRRIAETDNLFSEQTQHVGRQESESVRQYIARLRQETLTNMDGLRKDIPDMEEKQIKALESLRGIATDTLSKTEQQIRDFDERVRSEVAATIKNQGGDGRGPELILGSNAIHACAFNLHSSLIVMLLEFLPSQEKKQQAVNLPDGSGQTPLMIAAAKLDHGERRYQTCELLLELGADKSIVDPSGHTALGKFREGQRTIRDMDGTFGLAPPDPDHRLNHVKAMEVLLKSLLGPTEADDALLEEEDDEADDDLLEEEDDEADDALLEEEDDDKGSDGSTLDDDEESDEDD
jgi:hypothetical protein